jgi:hypothetical protein
MTWIKTDSKNKNKIKNKSEKEQRRQLIGNWLMAQPSSNNSLDNTGWTTKFRQPWINTRK